MFKLNLLNSKYPQRNKAKMKTFKNKKEILKRLYQ